MRSRFVSGLMAVLIVLPALEAACGGKTISEAASANGASSGGGGGTKVVTMYDPALKMTAYSMTIPADWMFVGAILPVGSCVAGIPSPLYRTSSPDGLIGMKQLPRLDWAWSDDPHFQYRPGPDCAPFRGAMSAADILKYLIGVLKVQYVRDEPVPVLAELRRNAAANSNANFRSTSDAAYARVRFNINNIVMDGVVAVQAGCSSASATHFLVHQCTAYVGRTWAPQGRLNEDQFDSMIKTMHANIDWVHTYQQVVIQKMQAVGQAQMAAMRNMMNQTQAVNNQIHQDMMAATQRGSDMYQARAAQNSNAMHQAAGDWCDYALNQQKRMDPNTGQISRDSSAYSYTWVNQSGQRFQTNDINANPNGAGTGNWTLQQNVH
jgi:hypothetical protein